MNIKTIIQASSGQHLLRALAMAKRHRNTRAVAIFSEELERRLEIGNNDKQG